MFFLVLFLLLITSGCSGSELGTIGTTGSSTGTLGVGSSTFVSSAGASPDSIGFSGSTIGVTDAGTTGSTTGSITGSIILSSPTILGSSRIAVVLFLRVFLLSFFSFCLDFIFDCSSSLKSPNVVLFFLVLFLLSFGSGTTGASPDSDGGITSVSFVFSASFFALFSYFSTCFWISPIRVSLLSILSSNFFWSFSNFFLSLLDKSGLDNPLFTSSICFCSSLISVFFSSMCFFSPSAFSAFVFLLPSSLCLL